MSVYDLPGVNASLNALSALFLSLGYFSIRRGRPLAHRNWMLAAFATSSLFLACYLVYHYYAKTTRFQGQGWIRPLYFTILLSHTFLATAIVPLVLWTLSLAWRGKFQTHRKIARWTWPLWMYVSVTGVIIYLLLYHIYPSR